MALLLHIDTASAIASVSIARDGRVIGFTENRLVNEHASFLQPAIKSLLKDAGVILQDMDAIAVVNGPGSYTGLRVGLASAKGLCFALDKPLITIGTLPAMAHAAIQEKGDATIFYAPMIDARRMEVFTAVYDGAGNERLPPCSKILQNDSYVDLFLLSRILFFGSGAEKWEKICQHPNALFSTGYGIIQSVAQLSFEAYSSQRFTDLAYSEPQYLKEFYMGN